MRAIVDSAPDEGQLPGALRFPRSHALTDSSELSGHVAGSFTGAPRARRGLIAAADGGTLFLDGDRRSPDRSPGRLLRVIESGRLRPVGADHERTVDVRFVAATQRCPNWSVGTKRQCKFVP